MSVPKVFPNDSIDVLIASPKVHSGAEAARVQPTTTDAPAHDAFTRRLTRVEPAPGTLWVEAEDNEIHNQNLVPCVGSFRVAGWNYPLRKPRGSGNWIELSC